MENKKPSLSHHLVSDSTVGMVSLVAGYGMLYLFNITVSRIVDAEQAGVFFALFSFLNLMAVFSRLGFDRMGLKMISVLKHKDDMVKARVLFLQLTIIVFCISIIIMLLVLLLGKGMLPLLHIAESDFNIFKLMVLGIPGLALSYSLSQFLRGLRLVGRASLVQLIILFGLSTLLGWFFYFIGGREIKYIVFSLLVSLLLSTLFGIGCLFHATRNSGKFYSLLPRKDELSDIWSMTWVSLMTFVISGIDILVLGMLVEGESVAYYASASRTVLVASVGLVAINSVVGPLVAAAHESGSLGEMEKISKQGSRLSLLVSVITAGFFIIAGKWLLILFGKDYVEALPVLIILLLGQLISSGSGGVSLILQMTGNEKPAAIILTSVVILMLPLYLIFIRYFDIVGAALVTAGGQVLWKLTSAVFVKRRIGISTYADNILCSIAFIIFCFILSYLNQLNVYFNIVTLASFIIASPIIAWKYLLKEEDRVSFTYLIRKKYSRKSSTIPS